MQHFSALARSTPGKTYIHGSRLVTEFTLSLGLGNQNL